MRKTKKTYINPSRNLKIKRTDYGAFKINITYDYDYNMRVYYFSDVHFDNPHCDRDLFKLHLDRARDEGAFIIFVGDVFDAMCGKNDRRGNKGALREEYKVPNYFDALVDVLYNFLKPYANNIISFSDGNHETSIRNHNEIDLTKRLVEKLNMHNPKIQAMPYKCWNLFCFIKKTGGGNTIRTLNFHGSGGASPVTRGTIGTARRAVNFQGADAFISGHSHQSFHVPTVYEITTQKGKVQKKIIHHVVCGCYKDETKKGDGWAVEKGMNHKTLGYVTIDFRHERGRIRLFPQIHSQG